MTPSKRTGAASAAPVVIPEGATLAQIERMEREAFDAIENVQDPDEAEALLRQVTIAEQAVRIAKVSAEREQRWSGLKLRAERKYGELLGPKQPGKRTDRQPVSAADRSSSGADREAQSQARKVAAVPQEDFDAYISEATKPTRAGLLRDKQPASKRRTKRKSSTAPPDAVDLLRRRIRQVRDLDGRDRPRWTLEDTDNVELVLKHLLKRRPKYSGKRLRELASKRGNGSQLADLQYRMMQLTSMLESVDVATIELADAEEASEFHDDLVELQLWMERSIAFASMRLSDAKLEYKISKLRDPTGRTDAERQTAARLADKLERRRRELYLTS